MNKKKRKITVGIIIDTALKIPPNTGVTYRLYFLSRELAKLGINVKLFLCNRNIKNDKNILILSEKSNIEYHIIPEKIFYNDKLFKIINKNKPDILQFEDCETLLRCKKIWDILDIPTCLEIHDVEATLKNYLGFSAKEIELAKKATKRACYLTDQIVCMTPLDFKELITNSPASKEKLAIIPNPIDTKFFPFYGPNLKNFNIVFVGNMFYWPNNNAAKVIIKKIYPKLKKCKKIKIYLIGMVPKNLEKITKNKNIIFTKSVTNLNEYLKKASIALCPLREGSGMKVKILNYCSAGLPIITTRIGASGYEKIKSLIVEDDIDKYADIITNLYSRKNLLFKIGKDNRKYVENFDIKKLSIKTIKLYKKIIRNHKPHSILNNKSDINKKPLWLKEKRSNGIKNKNYYIIKNGKIVFKEKIA
ncbi:MAG: glycosyltransferase family 4 protein [Candidatus Paceibacterota bacterium]|jgi:glycosyltransferase involved in cell wall biosynthesis